MPDISQRERELLAELRDLRRRIAREETKEYGGGTAGGSVDTFLELTDTPSTYSGAADKVAVVNDGETALEFGAVATATPTASAIVIADSDGKIGAGWLDDADIDHGSIGGLADDDHTQYHNDTRGDVRYYTKAEHIATSAGAGDAGKPVVLDAAGHIDATMINDADINLDNVTEGSTNKFFTATEKTKLSGIEAGADVTDAGNVGAAIDGATAKTTPVDADTMPLIDSAASNVLKKVTWANVKAALKTYLDTLYVGLTGDQTVAGVKRFSDSLRTGSSSTIYLEQAQAGVTITDTSWTTVLSGLTGVSLVYFQLNSNTTNYGGVFYVINNGGTITITPIQVTNMVAGEPGAGFNVGYQASGTALQMKAGASWPATVGCNIAASRLVW